VSYTDDEKSELSHRNDNETEIVSGLNAGDRIILYSGDRIEDGVVIEERVGRSR